MDDQTNDDMDSLFEGMVLFTPEAVVSKDASFQPVAVSSVMDDSAEALPSPSAASSEPLDENLFSDLTVITPYVEATETKKHLPSDQSPVVGTSTLKTEKEGAAAVPIFRQSSRKKKRAGLRIGYGRDSQLADELEQVSNLPESLPAADNSFSVPTSSSVSDLDVEGDKQDASLVSSLDIQLEKKCDDEVHNSYVNKELNLSEDNNLASTSGEAENSGIVHKLEEQEEGVSDSLEERYERIKAQISEKLRHVGEQTSSISVEKKESRRRRRKAAENVELASGRYKEIEKKLEEACEMEDFEMADRLSESLAAAEKEKVDLSNVLRDAEAYCDAIDSKMEEALEHQIIAEEECVSLLQQFSKVILKVLVQKLPLPAGDGATITSPAWDASSNADLVLESIEVNNANEMDRWFMSNETLNSKKLEIEIESQLVNDARSALIGSIELLAQDDIKEKEVLCEKNKSLTQDLEELLRLVKEKEAEIAENDSHIEAVEKRITEVFSGFKDAQTTIDANYGKLQTFLSEVESESEALSNEKEEIDNILSQGKSQVEELRKLSMASANEANMYQENLRLRKAVVLSVLKAREEKIRLAKTEEKILADTEMLKQEISVARASVQALSCKKSSVQQEGASSAQKMLFIDKRVPELEAEKKVAAAARNFKEAARLASEAKALTAEKETQHAKLEESKLELGKIDVDINETTQKLQELEELVSSKEREIAVTRFQRLRLVSAAASTERSAALELGDLEEAKLLLAEAETADNEAKELQIEHNIREEEFGNLSQCVIPMELLSNIDRK